MGTATILRAVNRGTPQGGVLSPLLWNLAINNLLRKLDTLKYKTVAYADDVAVAVSGFHLGTISQRLEAALKILSRWSIDSGLSVNPSKTELVLFSRRYKIESFTLPKLNQVVLTLSDNAKYLGVILDSKLSWKPNIMARAVKATAAMYLCKKAIGSRWGIKPNLVNWIFDAVIKPILFYGVTVWWTALDKNSNCLILDKVMRRMALLITGSLRTTSKKSLFTMMNWLPTDLMAKMLAMTSAVRLRATGTWTYRPRGHASIMDEIPDLSQDLDYCITKPTFQTSYDYDLSYETWVEENLSPISLSVYTDGSKRGEKVGGGVFIPEFGIKITFRLQNECSILQAEISAIKRAANWLWYYRITNRDIRIYTDSRAAIKSLTGVYTTSILVQECRASLNRMARHSNIVLKWVRGHGDCIGNRVADELAKTGTLLSDQDIDYFCGMPLKTLKTRIYGYFYDLSQARWENESSCIITRKLWPKLDEQRTSYLLKLSRSQLRNMTAIITGHCKFGTHARRIGLPFNDFCRSCHDVEEEESIDHLLCHCPALGDIRYKFLGQRFFDNLSQLSCIGLDHLNAFIRHCNWFGDNNP